jgi:hypothetical protein
MVKTNNTMTTKTVSAELGIGTLSVAKQKMIISRLDNQIKRKLALEVLDLLNQEDMKELDALIKKTNGKKIALFLQLKIPNIQKLASFISKQAVREFKDAVAL